MPMATTKLDAILNRLGITQTVLSLGNPWLDPFTESDAVDIAPRLNSDFATLGRRTGGRIVGMGTLLSAGDDAAVLVA